MYCETTKITGEIVVAVNSLMDGVVPNYVVAMIYYIPCERISDYLSCNEKGEFTRA